MQSYRVELERKIAMDVENLRALADKYRRLLAGMTDSGMNAKLRSLIAKTETRAAELEARAPALADCRASLSSNDAL